MDSFKKINLTREIYFFLLKMPDYLGNISSNIVYSAIGAGPLTIPRTSNNPDSFLTAIKPLVIGMNRQGVSIEKTNSNIIRFFNKY